MVQAHFPTHLPPLLFLTDPKRVANPVKAAAHLQAGSGVIYRHFGAANRRQVADDLARLCRDQNLALLIAADPELALQVGADGVHWPEAQLGAARHWRRQFSIQTASAHSRSAIRRAAAADMDAALVSTIFPSNSTSAGHPIGPARLARLAQATPMPLYGLGGVNADNARRISEFAGLAAIEGLLE